MLWRGPARPRRLPPLPGLVAVVAAAWGVVLAAHLTGRGGWFGHDGGGLPAWQVMTVAMMGPSALPVARYVAANTLVPGRAVAAFGGAYLLAWTAFLVAFGLADTAAHAVLPPLGAGGVTAAFGLAVAWQRTPYKRTATRACRSVGVLPAHAGRAEPAAARLGLRQGGACVVSCAPLMLSVMAVPVGRLPLMAGLTALAWVEKAADPAGLRALRGRWLSRTRRVVSAAR